MTLDSNDEDLFPDTELATTGISGQPSYLQDEDTSNWYTADDPSDGNDVSGRWGMQDPSRDLSGTQNVYVYLRHTGNSTQDVSVDIELYEAGSLVETIMSVTVQSGDTAGSEYSGTFDASSVSNGADVEIRFYAANTGGMPGNRDVAEIGYITWGAGLAQSLSITTDAESGVSTTEMTLNGTLEVSGYDNVDVWFEWEARNGYDITDIAYTGRTLDVGGTMTNPNDLEWKPDGTKFWIPGGDNSVIYEYSCTTAFDIETASQDASLDVSTQDATPRDVIWNDDGTRFTMLGTENDNVYDYACSTAYDITSASIDTTTDISGDESSPGSCQFNDDGTKFYMVGSTNDLIHEYDCSTAYDTSTISKVQTFDVSSEDDVMTGMRWKPDGTKLLMVGGGSDNFYEYDCSTAFDISTLSFSASFDILSEDGQPRGLSFNDDGTMIFLMGRENENIYEYHQDLANATATQTLSSSQSFSDTISSLSESSDYVYRAYGEVSSDTSVNDIGILEPAWTALGVSGTVTEDGNTTDGIVVYISYDDGSGWQTTSTTTATDGTYSAEVITQGNPVHVAAQYDDGTDTHAGDSKPFVE